MPITQASLTSAAFWHEHICLDCGCVQEEPHEPGMECDECSSHETVGAESLSSFITALEVSDD